MSEPSQPAFNANGHWIIEDQNHQGLSVIRNLDGQLLISAWAENRDDLWSWEAEITKEEFEAITANPSLTRDLLSTSRTWHIDPPPDVPRGPYTKNGRLDERDGFRDRGTGGIW